MSRDAGQITPREALRGVFAVALAVATIVVGADALLPRGEELPPPEGDVAQDDPATPCPIPRETLARAAPEPADPTRPLAVSSGSLYACPTLFDGQSVVYEGEVVRAVLHRGERAWVQLNDDPYALELGPLPGHRATVGANSGVAVSIATADAARITYVGSARAYGDRLLVQGTFLRADPADAGGPTIQADTVEITAVGHPITPGVTPARVAVALVVASAAMMMARAARRSADR